ncbi:MAG: GIY-YIG nuclease family protein [Alphaproteobacteria bacterium]
MKQMYVYIMASDFNGTLYVGVTSDLIKRVWQHKNHVTEGFTDKYDVNKLVYYETWQDELGAIQREKQLKRWNRKWKKELIAKMNPHWEDLYKHLLG